ncbi:MAG TPA: DUF1801 domain-containing protein [Chloroflexia bacterium]|nr:DUF1801 domain-containing protein [Chloroflexia bacterium]
MTPALPIDVDDYIAQAPDELQPRLQQLRSAIMAAAPGAKERISYGIPYYEYMGRLIYFQLWKKHIGLYALTTPVLAEHKEELKGRLMPKGTVRLPLDEELPVDLVTRLVKAQARENEKAEMVT